MALKSISTDSVKKYDSEQFSFETKGEQLKGHLVESVTLKARDTGKAFQKYVIRTPDGSYVSTLGGHQLDMALSQVATGTYVEITYNGKKKLDGGKTVKLFNVSADDENVISVEQHSKDAVGKTAKDAIAAMRAN